MTGGGLQSLAIFPAGRRAANQSSKSLGHQQGRAEEETEEQNDHPFYGVRVRHLGPAFFKALRVVSSNGPGKSDIGVDPDHENNQAEFGHILSELCDCQSDVRSDLGVLFQPVRSDIGADHDAEHDEREPGCAKDGISWFICCHGFDR